MSSTRRKRKAVSSHKEEMVGDSKRGILAEAAPLQLQCLLIIISHLYRIPSTGLALLPLSIRRRLLLLLPAIDVCKLEQTGVTAGISMDDEIWQVLYNERMPVLEKYPTFHSFHHDFYTTKDTLKEKRIDYTWKEAYFNTLFTFKQVQNVHGHCPKGFNNCLCDYKHFLPDMLYGIYSFYDTVDIYRYFSSDNTSSVHSIYQCAQKCPRLTPERYREHFGGISVTTQSTKRSRSCSSISLYALVNVLVTDCSVSLKHLTVSPEHTQEIWECFKKKPAVSKVFAQLFKSLESITVCPFQEKNKVKKMTYLLEIIFLKNKCPIKTATLCNRIDEAYPYLTRHPNLSMKQLMIDISIGTHSGEQAISVLKHFQTLEKVTCNITSLRRGETSVSFCQCIGELFYRPSMCRLELILCQVTGGFSSDILLACLDNFFSSPYPISFKLSLPFDPFDPLPEPLSSNSEQPNKCLELENSYFPASFSSVLPPHLVLKSLKLRVMGNDLNTLHAFANLKSINVFTLSAYCVITKDNISDICSLFHIVTAQEWDLDAQFSIDDDTVNTFASALPSVINHFKRFVVRFEESVHQKASTLSLLETIFLSLSSSRPAHFVFGYWLTRLEDKFTQAIREIWERCGAIKLKKLEVFVFNLYSRDGVPAFENSLKDMAIEVEVLRSDFLYYNRH